MKTTAALAMGVFLVLVSGVSASTNLLENENASELVERVVPIQPVPMQGGTNPNGECGANQSHNDSCEVGSGSLLLGTLHPFRPGAALATERFFLDLNNATYTVNNTTFTLNGTSVGNLTVQAIASGGTAGILQDVDLYAYDENGNMTTSCATGAADEICTIPASTQVLEVRAYVGALLDVTVVLLSTEDIAVDDEGIK